MKMILKRLVWPLCIILALSFPLVSEVIYLKDGSIIKGTLETIKSGRYIFKTSFGLLSIDRKKILRIIKTDSIPIYNKDGKKVRHEAFWDGTRGLENWYHLLSIGYPLAKISEGDTIGTMAAAGIDAFRFYWRIRGNPHFLIGGGISSYTIEISSSPQCQLALSSLSASGQYYIKKIGTGPYLRLDLGVSRGALMKNLDVVSGSNPAFMTTLAAGYAFPVSYESSFMLQLGYTYFSNKPGFHIVSLNAGWLW